MKYAVWFLETLAVFISVYCFMRIMGKRAVAQMNTFDLIVVFLLGSMFASNMSDGRNTWEVILTGGFLVAIYLVASFLMLNNKFRQLVHIKPTVLVNRGNINEPGLRQVRMTVPELLGHLRLKGYLSLADVEFAIMEDVGDISVIPKPDQTPVTPKDLNIEATPQSLPVPLILDGHWVDVNLIYLNKSRQWVLAQLEKQNIKPQDLRKLTLVQWESDGTLTVDWNDGTNPIKKQ
ncbi:DUF421 domain-containing protein [Effusibacillus dendaii]|uniref:DUF421 domain-containing protein n=1 Tax=Effusibacillus dendaii TaxID=2743772 RepID=UPI00190BE4C2|nr:DUF421 domain-containing protein [Effusibacillus dendaii]